MVGRLVDDEHVGSLPKRAGDLKLLALPEAQLAPAPGHLVGKVETFAQAAGIASEVERELRQAFRLLVGFLGAVDAEEPAAHRSGIRFERAAGDARERGLAAAVVAEQSGPAFWEGERHIIQNGVLSRGMRVGHARECKLHEDIPSLSIGGQQVS